MANEVKAYTLPDGSQGTEWEALKEVLRCQRKVAEAADAKVHETLRKISECAARGGEEERL